MNKQKQKVKKNNLKISLTLMGHHRAPHEN